MSEWLHAEFFEVPDRLPLLIVCVCTLHLFFMPVFLFGETHLPNHLTQVCSLALSEERLAHNCVVDLVAQATKLLTARQSDLVPHSTNEGDLCNDTEMRAATSAAVKKLQALLDKAAAVTASLNLSAEGMLDLSTVERLRELKLITAEEELLQFVLVRCCYPLIAIYVPPKNNLCSVDLRFSV